MEFIKTPLGGAFVLEMERLGDDRGFFARSWCKKEFESHDVNPDLVQCSVSFNKRRGTLRGMHYQVKPYEEAKLVRCTMGAIWDVIVDMRLDSPTFKKWFATELSAENRLMLYIPEGFAHGFLTLENHSEVFYQISEFYHPECARGVRWNDPAFNIEWPDATPVINDRDMSYPDFKL
ncbi:MAG: dTDP-4-dehydrorhamnose 3,5-epimerase [Syntrophales bacterium]